MNNNYQISYLRLIFGMSEKSHFMKALDDLKDSKEISTVVSKANKHAKKEKIKVLVDREMTKIKRMK